MKLLRQKDGYSFYEVPEELREKIINLNKDNLLVIEKKRGEHIETLTFQRILDNGKYLYENQEGDLLTIKKEEAERISNLNIEDLINKTFDASKYLNEHILPCKAGHDFVLSAQQDSNTWHDLNRSYNSVQFYGGKSWKYITVSVTERGHLGFFGFNKEGEFYNRDYNLNFNVVSKDITTFKQSIRDYLKEFDNYTKITKSSKNTFFVKSKEGEFALIPMTKDDGYNYQCGFEIRPKVKQGCYYHPGESSCKTVEPTNVIDSNLKELKEFAQKQLDQFFIRKNIYENIHLR